MLQEDGVSAGKGKEKRSSVSGPGKTTFAERVKLFQKLGQKAEGECDGETLEMQQEPPPRPPVKKITFLDICGQETSWKQIDKKETGGYDCNCLK